MKTTAGANAKTRSATVRLSDAISLESFKGDIDFLTNLGLAKRAGAFGNIAQSEIHRSYYSYTVAVDLDKIGIDEEDKSEISKEEKIERVKQFLNTIATLYRDIRGKRENLRPLFIIGGIYDIKNPFFENMIEIKDNKIEVEKLVDSIYDFVEKDTQVGMIKEQFKNDTEIRAKFKTKDIEVTSVSDFFKELKRKVEEYYNESN